MNWTRQITKDRAVTSNTTFRPDGAFRFLAVGFYKHGAPLELPNGHLQGAWRWGALASLLLLCLLPALPSANAATSFSIGNERGFPGATIPVPIAMGTSNEIVAAQFDVSYNPAKVSPGDLL